MNYKNYFLMLGLVLLSGQAAGMLRGIKPECVLVNGSMLHFAAEHDNIGLLQDCIEQGDDLNALDRFGQTALHRAVDNNCLTAVRILLESGARRDIRDQEGSTPYELACLCNHGAGCIEWLFEIAELVDNGEDVNRKDESGFTELHHAVDLPCKDTVRFLLSKGANVNVRSDANDGRQDVSRGTPLYYAVLEERVEIVKILLRHGADPNLGELWTGLSPLHVVAGNWGSVEVACALIDAGARMDAVCGMGRTFWDYAEEVGDEDFVQAIKKHLEERKKQKRMNKKRRKNWRQDCVIKTQDERL